MALCNAHYYATRDPLGVAGDFTTAPEISQMFGELVGVALGDAWVRAGSPEGVRLVELGPGRGTLMADLLRAARVSGLAPAVHFVETSPTLRAAQAERVPGATWHEALAQVPDDGPLLLVANEFFDALPVRQFVFAGEWRERCVGLEFAPVLGKPAPLLTIAPPGTIVETSPASTAIVAEIGARLRAQGGVALIIDYGYAGPATGDTLQAVRAHAFADPFVDPGEVDLTAHVDFSALGASAGVVSHGPVGQGAWLRALGIDARAAALKTRATGPQREAIHAATARLTGENAMGELFKVMALTGTGWPTPAGFAA
ncbi:SAM-dependent methyltransferase [Sphingosinicellaceae bacterium]|nr:SAM-dependent methyltransferase [Sphingosinicellaceae bacterium]